MEDFRFIRLSDDKKDELVDLFKALGDSTRASILMYLLSVNCVCVSDLAAELGMTSSAVSHQLRILKQNKLIKSRREGKQIMYSIADEHVLIILDMAVTHINENAADREE